MDQQQQDETTKKPHKKMRYDLPTIASLEGRTTSSSGRPQRTKKIPMNLRNKFMEVLDDDCETQITVYITNEGLIRRDYKKVHEELTSSGELIDESDSEVDLDNVLKEDEEDDAITSDEDEDEKKLLDSKYSTETEDDKKAIIVKPSKKDHDDDYVLGEDETEDEEEDEEDEEEEEEEEEDEEAEEGEVEEEEEEAEEEEDEAEEEEEEGSGKKRKTPSKRKGTSKR